MISKKQGIVLSVIFVVMVSIVIAMIFNRGWGGTVSVPRKIETPEISIEVIDVKQIANVVTLELAVENRQKTDVVMNSSQILLSIEPYYQEHVHEATVVKTLDYSGSNVIPADEARQVVVEFDVNHEITTDYYLLYSPQQNFEEEQLFYSLTLS